MKKSKCPRCGSANVVPIIYSFWFGTEKLMKMIKGEAVGYDGYPPFRAYPTRKCKKCGFAFEFRGSRDVRLPVSEQKAFLKKPFVMEKDHYTKKTKQPLGVKRTKQLLEWNQVADSDEEMWRGQWTDCPKCKRKKCVVPIVYGYPAPSLSIAADRGWVILGGCEIGDGLGTCKKCGHYILTKGRPWLRKKVKPSVLFHR